MFYTVFFLILWAVANFPALTAFNGPLIGLLIALAADLLLNHGWIRSRLVA